MNEEVDEGDFYHQDFTTASEWEIFIARMEEIIHEWKVQEAKSNSISSSSNSGNWEIKDENIQFADVEFVLSKYTKCNIKQEDVSSDTDVEMRRLQTVFNPKYDFLPFNGVDVGPEYSIEYYYGLQQFIILSATHMAINNESQIKLLLSSIHIVVSNSGCDIPIFVQIREKWQRNYQGIFEISGIRVNFEMVHLRKGPQHCKYLTGLLDLFKTKVASTLSLDPVTVSVQFSYHLSNWMKSSWSQESHDSDRDILDITTLTKLKIGVMYDPVSELLLNTTWLHLPEHVVVDSENYSDFDPIQAPHWSVEITMLKQQACILSECLSEFITLCSIHSTLEDILGDLVSSSNSEPGNPLDVLTESRIPTISSVLKRATSHTKTKISKGNAPICDEILVDILYYLFPDAEEDSKTPYCQQANKENISQNSFISENESNSDIENLCRGMKSCVSDSLVWRLSIVLAQAMVSLGSERTVAYLWYEFVQEMRYRWEKSIMIPGIGPGFPDHRTCLLHQKLQMLNCCIERKKAREAAALKVGQTFIEKELSSEEDSEEEFYDCDADRPEDEIKRIKHSLWNRPVGRLSKHGNLKLLTNGEQLYIPITQEPVPKTEDQLEEDTDVLLKLGSDAQGSELRARMMSASLLSDMESFKAANPDAILEDFIRWYSPRDWIEEENLDEWGQKTGHLSSRMLICNNTWVQMWESAKPVPAHRQKRLFDDTREAEKVLHYLDSCTPAQIAVLLLPTLTHAAIYRVAEECEELAQIVSETSNVLSRIIKTAERMSRDPRTSIQKYESLFQDIASQEILISQINSLMYKFNPSGSCNEKVNDFVSNLVRGSEVSVDGCAKSFIGSRLIYMFTEAQKAAKMITEPPNGEQQCYQSQKSVFPQPIKREFVMKLIAPRPASYSTPANQMLRATFAKNEFRLAGAFSEDTTFY